jgi:hypothetical protein
LGQAACGRHGSNGFGTDAGSSTDGGSGTGGSDGSGTYDGNGLSLLYYPGYVQNDLPPTQIDYTAASHIMHFAFSPTMTGTLCTCDMQSLAYPAAAIRAAHAAGKQIIVVIGGKGRGANFVAATSAANLAVLVKSIVTLTTMYGYDGVDIDWEESVTQAPYVALLQGLRTALGPDAFLSIDVDPGQHPPAIVAAAEPYVTLINDMTYWDSGVAEQSAYEHAGVPATKLTLGLGFPSGYFDQTEAAVQTKVTAIESNGWAGAMAWQIGNLTSPMTDTRLIPLRALVQTDIQ